MNIFTNFLRFQFLALLLGTSLILLFNKKTQAHGDVFHIFTPVIEKGGWGMEALSAYQTGLPNGEDADKVNFATEFAVHADITDYWMGKFSLNTAHEAAEEYKLDTVSFENVLRADKWTLRTFDAAWYSAMFVATDGAATNAVVFGPVVSYFQGPVSLVLNPFFEKSFGQNREEGMALFYAWRGTYQIVEKFSIGVEGYGDVENLGNSPSIKDQVHRVGPVLYFGPVHGNPHMHNESSQHSHGTLNGGDGAHNLIDTLSADVGVLFGLTENTSDTAVKFNLYSHY